MKLLILSTILAIGVSVSTFSKCADDRPDHCKYMGELCSTYPQEYYKCRKYDKFLGVYEYWYEILEDGDWRIWYSLGAMRDYYCF